MKNFFRSLLAFVGTLLCLNAAYAIPNNNHPVTFIGPTFKGAYTGLYNPTTAYSFLGEAGLKNFRVGATIGWQLEHHRLKVSGEYLWQKIQYPFFDGNTDEWVQQAAVGALYQYHFCIDCWDPTLDIRAYYSHALSKNLATHTGFFTNRAGDIQTFDAHRRIAGSNAGGIAPGVTVHPWCGTIVGAELNYDDVHYDKDFRPGENAIGWGGTARVGQVITDNIVLDLAAAFRKPFNNYTASLNWVSVPYYGFWSFSLDGAYTAGKKTLPSTWNVGVNANYYIDQVCGDACKKHKAKKFLGCPDNFLTWAGDPAVYMPQVLAIPDDDPVIPAVVCNLAPPETIGIIAPVSLVSGGTAIINAAAVFSPSSGLTYSISFTPAVSNGDSITINPTTGVITIHSGSHTFPILYTITVTAVNACGAGTTSVFDAQTGAIG